MADANYGIYLRYPLRELGDKILARVILLKEQRILLLI